MGADIILKMNKLSFYLDTLSVQTELIHKKLTWGKIESMNNFMKTTAEVLWKEEAV